MIVLYFPFVAGALDFFEKDVQDNPKNGYSYSWLAYLWYKTEEYGRALTAANKAVKFIPKKDGEYLSFAYGIRAETDCRCTLSLIREQAM